MQDKYEELEKEIVNSLSIYNYIHQLDPEIIEEIKRQYGDIKTYISELDNKENTRRIFEMLVNETGQVQKVILLRFGILDGTPRTLEEVANIMKITRNRVRQIESKLLRREAPLHRSKKLVDYLDD